MKKDLTTDILEKLLKGLDDIDWENYEHAYDTAEDTPDELRRLVYAKSYHTKKDALRSLYISVYHQSGQYSANPVTMPFLIRILKSGLLQGKLQEKLFTFIFDLATIYGYYWTDEGFFEPNIALTGFIEKYVQIHKQSYGYFEAEYEFYLELLKNSKRPSFRANCAFALAWLPQHSLKVIPALQNCYLNDPNYEVKITAYISIGKLAMLQEKNEKEKTLRWLHENAPKSKKSKLLSAYTYTRIYHLEEPISEDLYNDIVLLAREMTRKKTKWGSLTFSSLWLLTSRAKEYSWDLSSLLWDVWEKHLSLHQAIRDEKTDIGEKLLKEESDLLSLMFEYFFKKPFHGDKTRYWTHLTLQEQKQVQESLTVNQTKVLERFAFFRVLMIPQERLSTWLYRLCLPHIVPRVSSLLGWLPELSLEKSIEKKVAKEISRRIPELKTIAARIDIRETLCLNFPFTKEMLIEFEEYLDWELISKNANISFDEDLLSIFKEKWQWYYLGWNKAVKWDTKLVVKYKDKLNLEYENGISRRKNIDFNFDDFKVIDQNDWWGWASSSERVRWTEELIEKYKDKWKWYKLSLNKSLPWSFSLIKKFFHKWYWTALSENPALPWSEELLEHYQDYWSARPLFGNDGIPWTEELVESYSESVVWWKFAKVTNFPWKEEWFADNKHRFKRPDDWSNLSENPALPWSVEFLKKYKDKWDWYKLSSNTGVAWSAELIKAFENKWDWCNLIQNQSIKWDETMVKLLLKENRKLSNYFFEKPHNFPWTLELTNIDWLQKSLNSKDPVLYKNVIAPYFNEELVKIFFDFSDKIAKNEKKNYLEYFKLRGPEIGENHQLYSVLELK